MAYTSYSAVNTYLGTSAAGDNTLISDLITRAQSVIDTYTGRTFEHSSVGATRYFTVGVDTEGRTLYVDEDLCSTSTVVTAVALAVDGCGLVMATIPCPSWAGRLSQHVSRPQQQSGI